MARKKGGRITHRVRWALHHAYHVPDDIMKGIDLTGEIDSTLSAEENLKNLRKLYSNLNAYIMSLPGYIETEEARFLGAVEDYERQLEQIYQMATLDDPTALEKLREAGFKDMEDMEDYLVSIGSDIDALKAEAGRLKTWAVPPELAGWATANQLKLAGPPKHWPPVAVTPPDRPYGFHPSVDLWEMRVVDAATEDIWTTYSATPTYRDRYKFVKLQDEAGRLVEVIVPLAEYQRRVAPSPSVEIVTKARAKAAQTIDRKLETDVSGFPWSEISGLLPRLAAWADVALSRVAQRDALGLWGILDPIPGFLSRYLSMAAKAGEGIFELYDKREEPGQTVLLSAAERDRIWREFADEVGLLGFDPAKFRAKFDKAIAPNLAVQDNERIARNLIRDLLTSEELRKIPGVLAIEECPRLPPRPAVPGHLPWKAIECQIRAFDISAKSLAAAVKERNAYSAREELIRYSDIARKVSALLRRDKSVSDIAGAMGL